MRVEELLTRNVVVTRPNHGLIAAAEKMREEHVGALVVVDDISGGFVRPVGMLTDRDVVVGVLAKDRAHLDALEVRDLMTTDVVTATDDEEISAVLRRMWSFNVRRVPVVDAAGALMGLLSVDDVLVGLADELSKPP